MAVDVKMSVDERYKYLCMMRTWDKRVDRAGKSQLLKEMGAVTQQHYNRLIRQMNGRIAWPAC